MKRFLYAACAAAALALAVPAVQSFAAADDSSAAQQEQGQQRRDMWRQRRAEIFDARLVGFKASLALTSDQEKTWAPFEIGVARRRQARAGRQTRDGRRRQRPALPDRPDEGHFEPYERTGDEAVGARGRRRPALRKPRRQAEGRVRRDAARPHASSPLARRSGWAALGAEGLTLMTRERAATLARSHTRGASARPRPSIFCFINKGVAACDNSVSDGTRRE